MSASGRPMTVAEERLEELLRDSLLLTYDWMARVAFGLTVAFILLSVTVGVLVDDPRPWQNVSVPIAIGVIFGLAWWLSNRGLYNRAWSFGLGFAAASVPGARMLLGMIWDPLMPAIYIHSPDVWLWVLVLVVVGILLDRTLVRALAIYCAVQNLALFVVARPALATLQGDPALVDSVTNYEFVVARSIMIVGVGFMVGQHGVLIRELMRQIFVRLNEEELRGIRSELAREQAERSSEAKSALLANIGHELKTPLNATLDQAQALLTSPSLEEPVRDGLRVIRDGGEHLRGLIDDVMDMSMLESGHTELRPHEVHVRGLVRDVGGLMRLRAQGRGLSIVVDVGSQVPQWVLADAKRLRQVLLNLVGNAVKFTERGSIEVRVERGAAAARGQVRLCVSVRDTGVGIAPEDLGSIFSPFVQAGDEAKRSLGVGLGLAISQRLVRQMGGEIEVNSELGVGTTFRFEIVVPISATGVEPPSTMLPTDVHRPSVDELGALRALARDGKLKRLEQRVRAMADREPALGPFSETMIGLTRAFEDEVILNMLDDALERAAAGSRTE